MNAKFAERQPQILRLRPLRRTSLRMTDQLFSLANQSFCEFQIQDTCPC